MRRAYNMFYIYSYWTSVLVLLSWLGWIPSVKGSATVGMLISLYLISFGNMNRIHWSKKIFVMCWKLGLLYMAYSVPKPLNVYFELLCLILYLLYIHYHGKTIFEVYCVDIPKLHTDTEETITQYIRRKINQLCDK